eukprot:TRINITY_DN2545_c0_g1_i2.p1 TRINITY_DN2545_c0_g1~~TRINITY_DN2545_c0_g1_i2.p1  ORF type:complete len:250 (-),score=38.91 TRINITY_DN2545_c0_g1_i2:122-871(-)
MKIALLGLSLALSVSASYLFAPSIGRVNLGEPCKGCDEFSRRIGCQNQTGIEYFACQALVQTCEFIVCYGIPEVNDHKPIEDIDGDLFSTIFGLRGTAWRGEDCDDGNAQVYPGRAQSNAGPNLDYNCNKVVGGNATGSYEDIFCKSSQQRGVVLVGDSTGAHFGPPIYPFASPLTWETVIETEFDWPQCSYSTGYFSASQCEQYFYLNKTDSIYRRLWKRNHCNYGDYQNTGVNGARSSSISQKIVQT